MLFSSKYLHRGDAFSGKIMTSSWKDQLTSSGGTKARAGSIRMANANSGSL